MMDDEIDVDCEERPGAGDFKLPRFVSELGLPCPETSPLADAGHAVRAEFQASSKRKRLLCHRASVLAERDRGAISVVNVGASVEFDWTWEGATAFRPISSADESLIHEDDAASDDAADDGMIWAGEIVEVDERNGCLFISLDDPARPPTVGEFFVRPFEFQAVLDAVFNEPEFENVRNHLPSRLNAARGNVHPRLSDPQDVGLSHLREWWQHSWIALWGPPGTGKTYTTGQQIAAVLNDPGERILVVSTTNRATDAVARSIGKAASQLCSHELDNEALIRVGKGASYQAFVDDGLVSMLRGTESELLAKIDGLARQLSLCHSQVERALTRKQIGELKASGGDTAQRMLADRTRRVVVATVFKATNWLKNDTVRKMVQNGEAPFTTIFIDEAGLISRAAVAALALLASRRVVLAGDSKQLAPISRILRTQPTRQQTWLGSSGVSHLVDIKTKTKGVHVLSEQHRMHPEVCKLVSEFQYDGLLTTAAARAESPSQLAPSIANHSRTIWWVLDEEARNVASIRAERGPGNRSWIREITPKILPTLFADTDIRKARGLFISPFKAQAEAVAALLAQWEMPTWEASTVHSQQGTEADLVVFDTVNATNYTWPHEDWKRLVNVALSRAREAVIVLASRAEMDEPYLRPLLSQLTPSVLINRAGRAEWQSCAGNVERAGARTRADLAAEGDLTAGMGGQFARRREMNSILSKEQQRLTNLKLDGKPRLVRGVAGSGKSIVLSNWLARTTQRLIGEPHARIWAVYANRSLHKLLQDSIEAAWRELCRVDSVKQTHFPWEKVSLLHVRDVLSGILAGASLSMDTYGFDYDRAAEEFLNLEEADELLPRCAALFIDEAQDMGPSTLRLLLSVVEQSDDEDSNSRSAHIFYDNAQNIYGTKTPKWSDFGLDMRGRSTIMRESFRSTQQITELAVNVLSRLAPAELQVQQELISLGLIERTTRWDEEWLRVQFSQVNGPKPIYKRLSDRRAEMSRLADHLRYLIEEDGISATDICLIYTGRAGEILTSQLAPKLAEFGVELSVQTSRSFERMHNTLVATTPHSFKGYEAEVVMIPCVDCFVAAGGKILAHNLYVAMTRARSLLAMYGITGRSPTAQKIDQTLSACIQGLTPPEIEDIGDGPWG